jgi:ectoine hydroxylase-related dioxygenase (phytanoyl-CoA dioxygenase family)
MKTYGVDVVTNINSEFAKRLEEFNILGYSIFENVIDGDLLVELRKKIDFIYKIQIDEIGMSKMKEINEENLVRLPLAYSEVFKIIAGFEPFRVYLKAILGEYYILHLQNAIINMPNEEHHQSSWHRDLPYQNWVSTSPLACNLYFCIDDFNEKTGATFFLPYSQKLAEIPSIEYIKNNAIQINAKAGSVILFDGMLYHRAGYNCTKNFIRRGINNVYVKPIINQQIDIPRCLNGKYSDDSYFEMLLGYTNRIPVSVAEYREKRSLKSRKNQ